MPVGEHHVPAVKLELRLATEILRRRRDRSEPLIAFLRSHGCDTDLVVSALRNAGVPEQTRKRELAALTPERERRPDSL